MIDVMLEHGAMMPSPFSQLHLHQLGGAVARVGEDDTAFGNRRAAYAYNVNSLWMDPSEDERHEAANREFATALAPFSTGGVYVNFLGNRGTRASALPTAMRSSTASRSSSVGSILRICSG
jgi:hypothetical protein